MQLEIIFLFYTKNWTKINDFDEEAENKQAIVAKIVNFAQKTDFEMGSERDSTYQKDLSS